MRSHIYVLSLTLASFLQANDWQEWRGPNGTGAIAQGEVPSDLSPDGKSLLWKTSLPGRACSTPIVSKDHLFLTSPIDGKDALLAFDLAGKEKWRLIFGAETPGRGQRVGSGANSSPITDGTHVIGYFKSGRVVCATFDGKKLWEMNLQKKYGKDHLWWDQGTSPTFAAGNVVIAVMQTEGESYLISLDPKTGREVWKTERKFEVGKESGDSYTSPHVLKIDGIETIISFGADHVTGHNAKTGVALWHCGGLNPESKVMWRTIASSVVTEGIVVVPHGRGDFVCGIKAGGAGDITKDRLLWRKKLFTTDAATPTAKNGKVYCLTDRSKKRGRIICLDAKTGNQDWEVRLPRSPNTYYASPILVKDTLICSREDGTIITAKITEKGLSKITESKLSEALIASPIYAQGKLFFRSDKHLWCFGLR